MDNDRLCPINIIVSKFQGGAVMALKMKIAAALAALKVTSALGTAAYAADYFNLTSKVGESTVMPSKRKMTLLHW